MSLTSEKKPYMPPGPFVHMPTSQGNRTSYLVYCLRTSKTVLEFVYLESARLAEMDAFILAAALNFHHHHSDTACIVQDSRRLDGFDEFRSFFPGLFKICKTSSGQGESFSVTCVESDNLFCTIPIEDGRFSADALGELAYHLCGALNNFIGHLEAKLGSSTQAMQLSVT